MQESNSTPEPSFFQQRMEALGITDAINRITVTDPEAEHPQPGTYTTSIFTEEKSTGNIEILYYTVEGEVVTYTEVTDAKMGHINAKVRLYKTWRLKAPVGDMKYRMPKGQPTLPWFPPALVEKFRKGEAIEKLFVTEGVFKAMRGSLDGLDVVGLPSITCYKDPDGRLYSDLVRLIERCQVQYLIVLWDGDCLKISLKDLQTQEELTNRPFNFFNSAKRISDLVREIKFTKPRAKPGVWFMHVKSDALPGKPKGLDDLLIEAGREGKTNAVVHEARNLLSDDFYFYKKNITESTSTLHRYFALSNADEFYGRFREVIEAREWKFRGNLYKWSEKDNKLELLTPGWAQSLKWVGDEFFLEEVVPGAVRDRRALLHYNEGTMSKLFGKDFIKYLTHHKAFCNIPNHFNYQQVIELNGSKFYNRYFPFLHVEQEGKWDHILQLYKHIFGEHEVSHPKNPAFKCKAYELGLDYTQLLLTRPTQVLPVLCLYSPENNTGKSTLGKLFLHLFGDNAILIGNQDLQSDFNEQYCDKLLAICEETLLERKRDAERIKAMSTTDQMSVNPKGQKQYAIDFFCKFMFTSNNIRMVYVNKHDERFWIIRVPVLTKDDPDMLDKMKSELSAFIYYLNHRQLVTSKESRMWFHAGLIRTPVFEEVVRVNEPGDATDLREHIREWFIQEPGMDEIRMTLKEVRDEFFGSKAKVPWIQEILKDYLGVDLLRDDNGAGVFERGTYVKYERGTDLQGAEVIKRVEKPYRGRPYVFKRSQFIDDSHTAYLDQPGPANASAFPGKVAPAPAVATEDLPF